MLVAIRERTSSWLERRISIGVTVQAYGSLAAGSSCVGSGQALSFPSYGKGAERLGQRERRGGSPEGGEPFGAGLGRREAQKNY
jgi:hypothetical protein